MCEILLEAGAKLNERSIWGWHTFAFGAGNGWEECAKSLVIAGPTSALNKEGLDCCEYAEKRDIGRWHRIRPQMVRLKASEDQREEGESSGESEESSRSSRSSSGRDAGGRSLDGQ